jgi:hypothetical protein
MLGRGDESVLDSVGPEVFDHALDAGAVRVFLADPRHHIADRTNLPAMGVYSSVGGVEAPRDQVMFTFFLDDRAT